jgi:glutamyl-tRNA reductase
MDHNASTVSERVQCLDGEWSGVGGLASRGMIDEYMYLSTCNRSELYMVLPSVSDDGSNVSEALSPPGSRTLYGYDAVRHLLRVLLGLESMARGESHIVSQVKSAYASAGNCGRVLHRLFQRAIGMAATLRACYHPGREPSIPYIAVNYFIKEIARPAEGGGCPRALVAGLGALGREAASILLQMGVKVYVTNRSDRPAEGKIAAAERVPWDDWREFSRGLDVVFLCTGAETPILSAECADGMPDTWIFDLGSPHQSEPGGRRGPCGLVTLDDMREISLKLTSSYNKSLEALEAEAEKSSAALLAEISMLTDNTWKHLALARARALVHERSEASSKKLGVKEKDLEAFASSIIKKFLHPLISSEAAHSARAWRILSGEYEEYEER